MGTPSRADIELRDRKQQLRERVAARRAELDPVEARRRGARAAAALAELPEFGVAERVVLFASLSDEVDTAALAGQVEASGRPCLWPRCEAAGFLAFAPARAAELRRGRHGVSEPPADRQGAALGRSDLVVVPGVAFDASGVRLGRGGGWYDRRLAPRPAVERPYLVALALDLQVVARVPAASHDLRVDAIATESGVRAIQSSEGK